MFLESQLSEMNCKWKIKFLTITLEGITVTKLELTYLVPAQPYGPLRALAA